MTEEEEARTACMSMQRGAALNGGEEKCAHKLECEEFKSAMSGQRGKPRWVGVAAYVCAVRISGDDSAAQSADGDDGRGGKEKAEVDSCVSAVSQTVERRCVWRGT